MQSHLPFLREKASALPASPGVYLMKDAAGRILYVGKSRALKNRVLSYFVGAHNAKTERMVARVRDFDTVLCQSEMEALTLENVLIKKHTPPYNIKLKDAKSYPYIRITSEAYPRIVVTRDRGEGGRYFGPYSGMSDAYAVADAVNRTFRLPTCKRKFPKDTGKERPCLYASLGRCLAPCRRLPSQEEYGALIAGAREVLSGRIGRTVATLEEKMNQAAEEERFEEAILLRDTVSSLRRLRDRQRVVTDAGVDCDAVALAEGKSASVLSIISVREGAVGKKHDCLFSPGEMTDPETVFSFLTGFYPEGEIPPLVLLDFSADEELIDEFSASLSELAGRRITVLSPVRGEKKKLCLMAKDNALHRSKQAEDDAAKSEATLARLSSLLALEVFPDRIEAYDISRWGQEAVTASMVVYEGQRLRPSAYRLFRIKEGVRDDVSAMEEAIYRRLAHAEEGSPLPDLILVDGGPLQVGGARRAMERANVSIPVFGMVKDDFHKTRAITDGEQEISIALEHSVYSFIYKLQEEAHRVAIKSATNKKRRSLKETRLSSIPGIGPGKASELLKHFGSLRAIADAGEEELLATPKINHRDALAIRAFFEKERERAEEKKRPPSGEEEGESE